MYSLKEDLEITKRRMTRSEGTVKELQLRNKRAERNLEALESVRDMRREWDEIQEDLQSISKIHTGTEQRRGPGERENEESKQTAELQDALGTDEEREALDILEPGLEYSGASSHMEVADDSRERIRWSDPVTK